MSDTYLEKQWPHEQFAVFQDGEGNPPYYRPREADESLESFIDRAATTAVIGVRFVGLPS